MDGYRSLQLKNSSVQIYTSGEGDPVLFVHGACSSASQGELLATRLAPRYKFIAYTQRFHLPNSPIETGAYNVDTHASDLIEVVDTLGLKNCKVIGHSYGCAVILKAATIRNDLFSSLYLAEPGVASLLNGNNKYEELLKERDGVFRRIKVCFEEGRSAEAVSTLMRYANGSRGFISFPEKIRWEMVANASSLWRMISEKKSSVIDRNDLNKINIPVTVLLGQFCIPIYAAVAEEIKNHIPHTRVKRIPDCAHDLVFTRPREIAMALNN